LILPYKKYCFVIPDECNKMAALTAIRFLAALPPLNEIQYELSSYTGLMVFVLNGHVPAPLTLLLKGS
jgi:hypothetical protein